MRTCRDRVGCSGWLLWGTCLALVAGELLASHLVPGRRPAWYAAQTALANFVFAMLALSAAVGTLALRETLALKDLRSGALDPRTPVGFAQMRRMLLWLWALCLLIGAFGNVVAYGAATPASARPWLAGATALLVFHAPRQWLFVPSPHAGARGGVR